MKTSEIDDNRFTTGPAKRLFNHEHPQTNVYFNGVFVTSFNNANNGRGRDHQSDAEDLAAKLNAAVFHPPHARSMPR